MSAPKALQYEAEIVWTGNRGRGTSDYRAYERSYEISAGGKPLIAGSADPAFRGDDGQYNPEDLLIISVAACHMLWYLHLAADAGVVVLNYRDKPTGELQLAPSSRHDGSGGAFTEICLRPEVTISADCDAKCAKSLHHKAHDKCFIANTLKPGIISVRPTISIA